MSRPGALSKPNTGPSKATWHSSKCSQLSSREFLPDLEVSDEGGYWETRDLAALSRRRRRDRGPGAGISDHDDDDDDLFGLRAAQLKRALRGAAFARGALFPLDRA